MVTRALPSAGVGFLRDTPNSHTKLVPCSCEVTFTPLHWVETEAGSARAWLWDELGGTLQGLVAPRTHHPKMPHKHSTARQRQRASEPPAPRDGPGWSLRLIRLPVFLDPCFCVADLAQEALRVPLARALAWLPPPGWHAAWASLRVCSAVGWHQ